MKECKISVCENWTNGTNCYRCEHECDFFVGNCGGCSVNNCSCWTVSDCYYKQLQSFKKANDDKNELLQSLGIHSNSEFKRIKYYIDRQIEAIQEIKKIFDVKGITDGYDFAVLTICQNALMEANKWRQINERIS